MLELFTAVAEKLLRGNDRGQARKKERRIWGERARLLVSDNGGEEEEKDDEILVSSSVLARIRTMADMIVKDHES